MLKREKACLEASIPGNAILQSVRRVVENLLRSFSKQRCSLCCCIVAISESLDRIVEIAFHLSLSCRIWRIDRCRIHRHFIYISEVDTGILRYKRSDELRNLCIYRNTSFSKKNLIRFLAIVKPIYECSSFFFYIG